MKNFLFNHLTEDFLGIHIDNNSVTIELCIRISHLPFEYLKLNWPLITVVPVSSIFSVYFFQVDFVAVLVPHTMR